jgi:MFS family permease
MPDPIPDDPTDVPAATNPLAKPTPAPAPPAYEPPSEDRPATAAPTEGQVEREMPTVHALDYSPGPAKHDPYAAIRMPVFQLFIGNYWLAVIGSQVMAVAVQWAFYQRTGKALTLGILGAVQALPVITLALFAGHVADVFSRKRVLMVTQIVLVAAPVALAALLRYGGTGVHFMALAYGIVLINAIALTFARPARSALLPQLVSKEVFANAVTWNASGFELASMIGPAIGGFIIARWSTAAALIFSAICTAVCLYLTALLPDYKAASHGEPLNFGTLVAGVRFVWRTELVLATLTLDLFAVLLGGATFLLPVFARDILHVGPVGFGWLRAAPSLGALTMAMLIAHLPPMKRAGRTLLIAVAGFGAATIVFGMSRSFWLCMLMLYFTGAFDNVSVVVRHTLVQLLTPDAMRGRVSAVNQVFIGASNELGGFESGLTAAAFGPFWSVVGGGIGTILVVVWTAFQWPQIRRFGSLHDAGNHAS